MILMAGPCVIEDRKMAFDLAISINKIVQRLGGFDFIFKASYEKANRTSLHSFTGIGDEALEVLRAIRDDLGLFVITDVHESGEVEKVAQHVTHIQIPAFLCRQGRLLRAAAATGLPVNIKKGQFCSPEAMQYAVEKIKEFGGEYFLTERGSSFGYGGLVVDITSIPRMQQYAPVIMDATHCLQQPNQGAVTGGMRQYIPTMCYAATAVGVDGLFLEVHRNPAEAKSDSSTQIYFDDLERILEKVLRIRNV